MNYELDHLSEIIGGLMNITPGATARHPVNFHPHLV